MMNAVVLILMLLPAVKDDEVVIPTIGRPTTDFYYAAGERLKISASVDRTELSLDDWLVYTLRIEGLKNAKNVERPKLKNIDRFNLMFQIEELPENDILSADQRLFQYRLRPRTIDSALIPTFAFRYYDPRDSNLDTAFRLALSQAIPLKIVSNQIATLKMSAEKFLERWPGRLTERPRQGLQLEIIALFWAACSWPVWFLRFRRRAKPQSHAERIARNAIRNLANLSMLERASMARHILRTYLNERLGIVRHEFTAIRLGIVRHEFTAIEIANQIRNTPNASVAEDVESYLQRCEAILYGERGPGHDWVNNINCNWLEKFEVIADRIEGRIP